MASPNTLPQTPLVLRPASSDPVDEMTGTMASDKIPKPLVPQNIDPNDGKQVLEGSIIDQITDGTLSEGIISKFLPVQVNTNSTSFMEQVLMKAIPIKIARISNLALDIKIKHGPSGTHLGKKENVGFMEAIHLPKLVDLINAFPLHEEDLPIHHISLEFKNPERYDKLNPIATRALVNGVKGLRDVRAENPNYPSMPPKFDINVTGLSSSDELNVRGSIIHEEFSKDLGKAQAEELKKTALTLVGEGRYNEALGCFAAATFVFGIQDGRDPQPLLFEVYKASDDIYSKLDHLSLGLGTLELALQEARALGYTRTWTVEYIRLWENKKDIIMNFGIKGDRKKLISELAAEVNEPPEIPELKEMKQEIEEKTLDWKPKGFSRGNKLMQAPGDSPIVIPDDEDDERAGTQ